MEGLRRPEEEIPQKLYNKWTEMKIIITLVIAVEVSLQQKYKTQIAYKTRDITNKNSGKSTDM